ncbi:MAG: phosphate propanoyltransferase [Eubacteriaceae bacterium]|jgi:putative phosphotransacetylase
MTEVEKKVIEQIVYNTVVKLLAERNAPTRIPLGVSNKHIHLTQEAVETLFGKGHKLTPIKDLGQPGQFACQECVDMEGPKGVMKHVRVLGPERAETQIEISMTDARMLGIKAPVRESGCLKDTPGIRLIGPEGSLDLDHGVIVALRHIHMPPDIAKELELKDGDSVFVETSGIRPTLFRNVLVRVSDKYSYEMHIDTDEANAAGLKNGDILKLIKQVEL